MPAKKGMAKRLTPRNDMGGATNQKTHAAGSNSPRPTTKSTKPAKQRVSG